MRAKRRRLGILTGGGDCPGLNAVIRAVVKTAAPLEWEVVGISDGFDGLILPGKARRLMLEDVRGILPRGGTILGTTNRGNPFAYPVQDGDTRRTEDRSQQAIETVRSLALDALIVIGGDGSLTIAHKLGQLGLPIVGVPKTIDNDISATDVTFGFDTAVSTACDAIDKLHTTAESHHRVMVIELMGRNAGWIALEAGLAGGGDIILIPEIPFCLQRVADTIAARDKLGRNFSIVVVAEGAIPVDGQQITQPGSDTQGATRLGGVGNWLVEQLAARTEHEVRVTTLGHLQRGGSPTAFDRILGTRYGVAAVEAVSHGSFGEMVALHGAEIVTVPLAEAVGVTKLVPRDGPLVTVARRLGIGFGD